MAMPSSRKERSRRSRWGSSSIGLARQDVGDFIDAVAQLQRAVLDMHAGLADAADSGH